MHLEWRWCAPNHCTSLAICNGFSLSFSERCNGLSHSFSWPKKLTSRFAPGKCWLVKRIATIRPTRCTLNLATLLCSWDSNTTITISSKPLFSIWHYLTTFHSFLLIYFSNGQICLLSWIQSLKIITFLFKITWHVRKWLYVYGKDYHFFPLPKTMYGPETCICRKLHSFTTNMYSDTQWSLDKIMQSKGEYI